MHGLGNAKGVVNMLRYLGHHVVLVDSPFSFNASTSDLLIIPGVGHFSAVSDFINRTLWSECIQNFAALDKAILGICLGAQLLCKGSDEGGGEGLGFFDTRVESLLDNCLIDRRPRVGWYDVDPPIASANKPLFKSGRFYFIHSFAIRKSEDMDEVLHCDDLGDSFVTGFRRRNIIGVQFHPEKSHKFGLSFFRDLIDEI